MRSRAKPPFVPVDRHDTVRREIVSSLKEETLSARELSQKVGIPESEVLSHLEHIRLALRSALEVEAASCLGCGFVFTKREKLKGPGKCPVCRSEHIAEPRFSVL